MITFFMLYIKGKSIAKADEVAQDSLEPLVRLFSGKTDSVHKTRGPYATRDVSN